MSATTRRALLGTAMLAPLGIAAVAMPAPAFATDTATWDAAVARLHATRDEFEAACCRLSDAEATYFREQKQIAPIVAEMRVGDTVDAYHERLHLAKKRRAANVAALEARLDLPAHLAAEAEASTRHTEALHTLLDTPAPTLAAAIDKLEIAIEHEEPTDPVLAELRVLAGEARS